MPVQLAGYVVVVEPVADRAALRARGRVAVGQPLLYQRLHLLVGELVAQFHRRVARYGGEDPLLPAVALDGRVRAPFGTPTGDVESPPRYPGGAEDWDGIPLGYPEAASG